MKLFLSLKARTILLIVFLCLLFCSSSIFVIVVAQTTSNITTTPTTVDSSSTTIVAPTTTTTDAFSTTETTTVTTTTATTTTTLGPTTTTATPAVALPLLKICGRGQVAATYQISKDSGRTGPLFIVPTGSLPPSQSNLFQLPTPADCTATYGIIIKPKENTVKSIKLQADPSVLGWFATNSAFSLNHTALFVTLASFSKDTTKALFGEDAYDFLVFDDWKPPQIGLTIQPSLPRCFDAAFVGPTASGRSNRVPQLEIILLAPQREVAPGSLHCASMIRGAEISAIVGGALLCGTLAAHGARTGALLSLLSCMRHGTPKPSGIVSPFGFELGGDDNDTEWVAPFTGAAMGNILFWMILGIAVLIGSFIYSRVKKLDMFPDSIAQFRFPGIMQFFLMIWMTPTVEFATFSVVNGGMMQMAAGGLVLAVCILIILGISFRFKNGVLLQFIPRTINYDAKQIKEQERKEKRQAEKKKKKEQKLAEEVAGGGGNNNNKNNNNANAAAASSSLKKNNTNEKINENTEKDEDEENSPSLQEYCEKLIHWLFASTHHWVDFSVAQRFRKKRMAYLKNRMKQKQEKEERAFQKKLNAESGIQNNNNDDDEDEEENSEDEEKDFYYNSDDESEEENENDFDERKRKESATAATTNLGDFEKPLLSGDDEEMTTTALQIPSSSTSPNKNNLNNNNLLENENNDDPDFLLLPPLAQDILRKHNQLRKLHGAPPLTYDSTDCEKSAKKCVEECSKKKKLIHCHDSGKLGEHGQNLYFTSDGAKKKEKNMLGSEATQAWYDEMKKPGYDFSRDGADQKGVGHFTQVVWSTTTKVGVAVSNDGNYICCNYFPAGNFAGMYLECVKKLDENKNTSAEDMLDELENMNNSSSATTKTTTAVTIPSSSSSSSPSRNPSSSSSSNKNTPKFPPECRLYNRRYGYLLREYNSRCYWFYCVEIIIAFLVGVVEGLRKSKLSCQAGGFFLIICYLAYLIFVYKKKPFILGIDYVFVLCFAGSQLGASFGFLAGSFSESEMAFTVAFGLTSVGGYLVILRCLSQLLHHFMVHFFMRKIWPKIKNHLDQKKAAEKRKQKEEEMRRKAMMEERREQLFQEQREKFEDKIMMKYYNMIVDAEAASFSQIEEAFRNNNSNNLPPPENNNENVDEDIVLDDDQQQQEQEAHKINIEPETEKHQEEEELHLNQQQQQQQQQQHEEADDDIVLEQQIQGKQRELLFNPEEEEQAADEDIILGDKQQHQQKQQEDVYDEEEPELMELPSQQAIPVNSKQQQQQNAVVEQHHHHHHVPDVSGKNNLVGGIESVEDGLDEYSTNPQQQKKYASSLSSSSDPRLEQQQSQIEQQQHQINKLMQKLETMEEKQKRLEKEKKKSNKKKNKNRELTEEEEIAQAFEDADISPERTNFHQDDDENLVSDISEDSDDVDSTNSEVKPQRSSSSSLKNRQQQQHNKYDLKKHGEFEEDEDENDELDNLRRQKMKKKRQNKNNLHDGDYNELAKDAAYGHPKNSASCEDEVDIEEEGFLGWGEASEQDKRRHRDNILRSRSGSSRGGVREERNKKKKRKQQQQYQEDEDEEEEESSDDEVVQQYLKKLNDEDDKNLGDYDEDDSYLTVTPSRGRNKYKTHPSKNREIDELELPPDSSSSSPVRGQLLAAAQKNKNKNNNNKSNRSQQEEEEEYEEKKKKKKKKNRRNINSDEDEDDEDYYSPRSGRSSSSASSPSPNKPSSKSVGRKYRASDASNLPGVDLTESEQRVADQISKTQRVPVDRLTAKNDKKQQQQRRQNYDSSSGDEDEDEEFKGYYGSSPSSPASSSRKNKNNNRSSPSSFGGSRGVNEKRYDDYSSQSPKKQKQQQKPNFEEQDEEEEEEDYSPRRRNNTSSRSRDRSVSNNNKRYKNIDPNDEKLLSLEELATLGVVPKNKNKNAQKKNDQKINLDDDDDDDEDILSNLRNNNNKNNQLKMRREENLVPENKSTENFIKKQQEKLKREPNFETVGGGGDEKVDYSVQPWQLRGMNDEVFSPSSTNNNNNNDNNFAGNIHPSSAALLFPQKELDKQQQQQSALSLSPNSLAKSREDADANNNNPSSSSAFHVPVDVHGSPTWLSQTTKNSLSPHKQKMNEMKTLQALQNAVTSGALLPSAFLGAAKDSTSGVFSSPSSRSASSFLPSEGATHINNSNSSLYDTSSSPTQQQQRSSNSRSSSPISTSNKIPGSFLLQNHHDSPTTNINDNNRQAVATPPTSHQHLSQQLQQLQQRSPQSPLKTSSSSSSSLPKNNNNDNELMSQILAAPNSEEARRNAIALL